jgi:hypothetical protein
LYTWLAIFLFYNFNIWSHLLLFFVFFLSRRTILIYFFNLCYHLQLFSKRCQRILTESSASEINYLPFPKWLKCIVQSLSLIIIIWKFFHFYVNINLYIFIFKKIQKFNFIDF